MDQYSQVELGLIIPLNIETNPTAKGNALKFGDFAGQDYNNKQEAGGGGVMLEFVKPLKINIQGAAGFNYYITFEIKDVGASEYLMISLTFIKLKFLTELMSPRSLISGSLNLLHLETLVYGCNKISRSHSIPWLD